jgi:vancomycin aglycone glucosyltransferase
MIEATVATQFATIGAAADDCDVIVAASALQVAAGSIAEKRAIPYVFAAYAPTVLPSPHHGPAPLPPVPDRPALPATDDNRELWNRNAARFNDSFGAPLNAHRAAIGLAPVDDVQRYMFTAHPWLAADAALAPWPGNPEYQVFQTGAWILSDGRPLSREIEAFLTAGDPPIFFGFGSMRAAQDVGKSMIHAARAVGRRAIVSSGWADLSVEDASDCLTIGEANLQTLFTRVAAVVHHGGAGTTTLAALGGAPQVVVPQIYDQHYSARRITELGIGVAQAPGVTTGESLATALEQALRPDVTSRARAIAAAVRRDGARVAAKKLIA